MKALSDPELTSSVDDADPPLSLEDAARWLLMLEDCSPQGAAAFQRWLERSPQHVEDFLRVAAIEALVGEFPSHQWEELGPDAHVGSSPGSTLTPPEGLVRTSCELAERLSLEDRLRNALERDEFVVCYQPQLNCGTGRIEAIEALLHWNDPEEGLVPPGRFLSTLESSGLIVAAGEWVLRKAAEDCRRLQELGFGPMRVAVNISAGQIARRKFIGTVREAAAICVRDGGGLDVEIPESVLLSDLESATRKLSELADMGVRVVLDDFGTGYAPLSTLSQLPVHALKIDRCFVRELPGDAASATLVSCIVGLAKAWGLACTAEGIETLEQLESVKRLGCDSWQGFAHSRAVPLHEVEAMLARQHAPGLEIEEHGAA